MCSLALMLPSIGDQRILEANATFEIKFCHMTHQEILAINRILAVSMYTAELSPKTVYRTLI